MSFTDIFIRRPVLASVVSLLILLIGLASAFNPPVRQFPRTSNTTITITTTYPGANADLIKGFITTPLQQAVASTEGIDTLPSSSMQNASPHPPHQPPPPAAGGHPRGHRHADLLLDAERQPHHAQPAARCRPGPGGRRRAVEN